MPSEQQKPIQIVPIVPPPPEQRVGRGAAFAGPDERRTRYSLPEDLLSSSPVGYRTRVSLTEEEAQEAALLLSLRRPPAFVPGPALTDQELFEECALGVLTSRQSTNYRGHRQVSLGPEDSERLAGLLTRLSPDDTVSSGASHSHIVLAKPYRTPFTMLLTFIGHAPVASLFTVPLRAWRKRFEHVDDIPTIGYLQHLHVGILADAMERAAVLASTGKRAAQVHLAPFCQPTQDAAALAELEELAGLSAADRRMGWRVALVAQVGYVEEPLPLTAPTCRKLGANLLALRSERIQPGVNQEEKAPAPYQARQDMRVPDELVVMAGRAVYNAFAHWSGVDREAAKDLLIMDRIDVLTPDGKQRLRAVRTELGQITERVVRNLPLWVDLPTGKALSRNAARGRKAFALAGQRIYIGGLSKSEIAAADLPWELAVCALGAAASRGALVCELAGSVALPEGCDLLAGICLMAGPVNQNDVGKQFYGYPDLLSHSFGDRDPTSLLLWTLKAKTVADPIGNEEQLMNRARKGALVDLRGGPHELVQVRKAGALEPLRKRDGRTSSERAFWEVGDFVTDSDGAEIPGNRGSPWPAVWAQAPVWEGA